MQVKLYVVNETEDFLKKSLHNEETIEQVTLLENTSVDTPEIVLRASDIATFIDFNYAYIPQFKRYYYIQNRIFMRGQNVKLILESDAMYTWKNGILKSYQLIERQQHDINKYLADNEIPLEYSKAFKYYKIGDAVSDFNNPMYVLQTAGRAGGD